jgi:hypothetical protein
MTDDRRENGIAGPVDPEAPLRTVLRVDPDPAPVGVRTAATITCPFVRHPSAADDARERLPALLPVSQLQRDAETEGR